MNNITITTELCPEDRARLDRLYAVLTHLADRFAPITPHDTELDELQQKLAAAMKNAARAQAPKNAPGEAQDETPADIQPEQEADAAAEPTHPAEADLPWGEAPAVTVTREQIQQKVVQLSVAANGSKKAKVREIVNAYAKNVSGIPEDKFAEVWDKLTALEKEA